MRLRFRTMAGVLTLLALSLSFAEGVWASVCESGMADMADMPMEQHAGMNMPDQPADEVPSEHQGQPESDCPVTLVTGACTGSLQLPAGATAATAAPWHEASIAATTDLQPTSPTTSEVFRPPRG